MSRAALILTFVGGVVAMSAQSPGPPQSAAFAVASIKLNTTSKIPLGPGHLAFLREAGAGNARNGRFFTTGDVGATPLIVLIQLAYNVREVQIDGGPSWVRSDRYEVDARADGPATFEQMRPMLQSLLADRFKLTLRRETREFPVYDLVVAEGGLKVAPTKEGTCVAPERAVMFGPLSCGGVRKQFGPRSVLEVAGIPMRKLAELLSDEVDRIVIDRTGFTDLFSFSWGSHPFAIYKPRRPMLRLRRCLLRSKSSLA